MEQPERLRPDRQVTVDDVRQLMGSSTPHFALQLRERIRRLIAPLGADDPARRLGEDEATPVLGAAAAARGVPGEQPVGHDPTSSNVG